MTGKDSGRDCTFCRDTGTEVNVYVCHTYYHLYVAMVLSYRDHQEKKDPLIVLSLTRNVLDPGIVEQTGKHGWYRFLDLTDQQLFNRLDKASSLRKLGLNLFLKSVYPRLSPGAKLIPKNRVSTLYLFNDFHYLCRYLVRTMATRVILLEDGYNNYRPVEQTLKVRTKQLLGIHPPYGWNPRIAEIRVRRPEKLPHALRHKGRALDFEHRLKTLPEPVRKRIVNTFLPFPPEAVQEPSVLILTQPLYDFGRVTLDEHRTIYGTIVDFFQAKGWNICLKPHPSDRVRYDFGSAKPMMIPTYFPAEILNESRTWFTLAVGVSTTAIFNLSCTGRNINLLPKPIESIRDYAEVMTMVNSSLSRLELQGPHLKGKQS